MAQPFAPKPQDSASSFGLLLVRVVVGIAFILHGWPKIQHPLDWMQTFGMQDAAPGILQLLAALAEVAGGAGLVLGFLTPLAALGLLATMGYALFRVHIPAGDPFVAQGRSWELAAVYFCVSAMFLLTGPGRMSVDAHLFKR